MTLPTADALRTLLEPHVAPDKTPGLVALAARGDDVVVVALGAMAEDGAEPMRRDAIFRIASMTKPVTAIAALMLIEDGRLALDEPVDRLLPELANRRVLRSPEAQLGDTVPAKRPITVEDLLTFRCGLGVTFGPPEQYPILAAIQARNLMGFGPPDPTVSYGPDEYVRLLGELPLMAQPGEAWLYSAGSNILGVLIERAAGAPLGEVFRARIFEPLGMRDTGFWTDAADRLPVAYGSFDGRRVFDDPADSAYAAPPRFPAGDAGLVSTADDFLAFSRFLLSGGLAGGRRLLSEAAVQAMTRDHLTEAQRAGGELVLGAGHGWGYGVAVANRRSPEGVPAGAFGWNGGLGTGWIADPATATTALLLTQVAFTSPDPPAVHKSFWRAVFG
ncbi:MAG TPA: serine hydrolase domain-containing protein [Caulobacteraceae bacterium]|nr:serine hydrolase domain-containing protein [Caulobacteraceae bacterium]